MAINYYTLNDLKNSKAGNASNVRQMVAQLAANAIFAYRQVNFWGKAKRSGACRCAAKFAGQSQIITGVSTYGECHAEEDLIQKISQWTAKPTAFEYLYVDIEPCHNKRYKGHDCLALLNNTFTAGEVYFAYTQDEYQTGDLGRFLRDGNPDDQCLLVYSLMGYYPGGFY